MNTHNPELQRQAANHAEVRNRLWCSAPKPKVKPAREPVYVRYMVPQIPLWSREDIHFDAHVQSWQWELVQRQSPAVLIQKRCEFFGIPYPVMVGHQQRRDISHRRQLVMWEIITEFGLSFPQTGRLFGKDHTTVLHAFRKVDAMTDEQRAALNTPIVPVFRPRS